MKVFFRTVSKFNKESTALDLALLSCRFMSRLYLVLHSVMTMVRAGVSVIMQSETPLGTFNNMMMFTDGGLTEVQSHADEDDQAEPGVEVCDEVDDRNDDISDGREDAEHDVAAGGKRHGWVKFLCGKTV